MSGKPNTDKPAGPLAKMIACAARPFLRRFSDLGFECLRQPGSWQCLEIIYRNKPQTLLDVLFLNNRPARGARNRLRIFQEEIRGCIERQSQFNNPVRLISFGSGPGHEILGCLEKLKDNVHVSVTCIDKERSALECGESLAARKGLREHVEYVQGNVLRMKPVAAAYNIAIMSGLIDYFSFETAVSVLKMVGDHLLPGGTVMIANMRRHYLARAMSILGDWNLVYREPEEVERILTESGYVQINVWLDPEEVFCIGKARTQC